MNDQYRDLKAPTNDVDNKYARQVENDVLDEFAEKSRVAEIFKVSERTIERWVRMRWIPSPVRIGNTSLFHLPTLRKSLMSMNGQSTKGGGS